MGGVEGGETGVVCGRRGRSWVSKVSDGRGLSVGPRARWGRTQSQIVGKRVVG